MDEVRALNIAIYGLMYWSDPTGESDPEPDFGKFDDVDVEMAIVELTEMRNRLANSGFSEPPKGLF